MSDVTNCPIHVKPQLNSVCFLPSSLRKGGFNLGRTEIKEVAERRKREIRIFIESIFANDDVIAHSELIYTFFHPLLRDEEETNLHKAKLKGEEWSFYIIVARYFTEKKTQQCLEIGPAAS